ncbi:unnamed protein product [Nippostrongylus brasiliensis]|uniref:CCHC-type domain-containing protein n=1 Tax=Nippostrongylus brasiliensis TaxID=27835 RepID=A0A0N4YWX3_NIPBR|nr:unnamed protein product [Nippostrongylus brasiliensis]
MSGKALVTERAHLLYQQLVHWPDSYHLIEALEDENDAYGELKDTAKRIERRNQTPRNGSAPVANAPKRGPEVGKGERPRVEGTVKGNPIPGKRKPQGNDVRAKGPLCFKCKETGHFAQDCSRTTEKHSGVPPRSSLSARLAGKACRVAEVQRWAARSGGIAECPLFGEKMSTELEVFGRRWKGLLDTGSEISILPPKILLQAKHDGYDIDSDVPEFPIDES